MNILKRSFVWILVLSMVFALTACGGSNGSADSQAEPVAEAEAVDTAEAEVADTAEAENAPAPETAGSVTGFSIGFPEAPIDVPAVKAIKINTEKVALAAGGMMNNEVFDFTPEGTVDAVEKMIANGVQGIKITPSSDSIIPTVKNMCEDAGVYFILCMRTIGDEAVLAMCEESEYFLGCVYEDDYATGYALGKALAETGATTYALIGTAVGDTTGDTREAGLAQAAEEFGLTQVAEVRALQQASDATQAVESFLAAYPDLGGIIRIASTAAGDVAAICAALDEAGKGEGQVKFVSIDTEGGEAPYFESGTLTATLGNANSIDSFISTAILVNAVQGNRLNDEPVDICIPLPVITSADELEMESTYVIGEDGLYPEEYIQQHFLASFNPDLTMDDILSELDMYSPSYIASLWE